MRGGVCGGAAGDGVSCSDTLRVLGAYRRELPQVQLRGAHALLVRHEGRAVAARVKAHLRPCKSFR